MTKKRTFILLCHMLAVLALTVVATAAASAATLKEIKDRGYARVAVANEIPYGYVDSSGKAEGFSPSSAKAALKGLGIDEIQWTVMPYGSLIPALKADRVDIVASSLAVLPQRCTQVDYTIPNTTYGEGLLVKKGNPKDIHSYKDFKKNSDLKMGIVSGADQLDFAHDVGIPDSQLVMLKANTDAASAVASGRIDAYAATQFTVVRLAEKSDKVQAAEPFTNPKVNGESVRSWGALAVKKGNDSLRKALNKQLKKYHKSGKWEKMLKHYGMDQHSIDMVSKKSIKELCSKNDKS
jgi:polar amino acid transport system substrate-binding protein